MPSASPHTNLLLGTRSPGSPQDCCDLLRHQVLRKCQVIIFYLNIDFPQHPLAEHPKEALAMKEKQDPALLAWSLCSHPGDIRVGTDIPRPGAGVQEAPAGTT